MIISCWNCGKKKGLLDNVCRNCGASLNGIAAPVISDKSYDVPLPPSFDVPLPRQPEQHSGWQYDQNVPGRPIQNPQATSNISHIISASAKDRVSGTEQHDVTIGTDILSRNSVSLQDQDRPYGTVLLGQTGFGKTSVLEQTIMADLKDGTTAFVFDPHGELTERLLRLAKPSLDSYFLLCEITGDLSYGFNPLEVEDPNDPMEVSRTVDSLLQVFRRHWSSNSAYAFGSTVEWILSNTARTIIANSPNYTLAEIPLLLRDRDFRQKLVAKVQNPQVLDFWARIRQLDNNQRPRDLWEEIRSTSTRLSQFLSNEWLYRVLYQAKGTVNFSKLLGSQKVIVFSLPVGKLGEEPAALLGSLLLGKLATTILSRLSYGTTLPPVNIYIDEYARFSVPVIADLWTQARKFNCGLTATLQTLSQIKDEENRAALLQAGNLICFQLIGSDAEILARQMPLPDPASLMKPEPMLLISQTPVEDIWHTGHPNKAVMAIRDEYFWIIEDLKRNPHQEYFQFDPTNLLQQHPSWKKLDMIWDMYCSSAEMLKKGILFLNQYYYNWMSHQYMLGEVTSEEILLVKKILECLAGYYGWRPVMHPFMTAEKQDYLYHHLQEWIDHIGERYYHEIPKKHFLPPLNKETNWRWEKLKEEHRQLLTDLRSHRFVSSIDDPNQIKQVALKINMPSHEIDRLIEWKVVFNKLVDDLYTKTVKELLNTGLQKIQLQLPEEARGLVADYPTLQQKFELSQWQTHQTALFLKYGLRECGAILQKEPLYVQSHTYRDTEYSRRTYSDVRDELVTKLVSLPRYQAICSLVANSGELPIQIKTLPPLQIPPNSEQGARAIREASRKQVGHPWQQVYQEMQTRQQLPPAKPHI